MCPTCTATLESHRNFGISLAEDDDSTDSLKPQGVEHDQLMNSVFEFKLPPRRVPEEWAALYLGPPDTVSDLRKSLLEGT
jgi:hypothetical protein